MSDDGGEAAPPTAQTTEPVAVNANGLATLAEASGQPIYWVGPREGWMYELRQEGGQVFVRYLPPGVTAGDAQARLSIATYPVENAYDVTTAAAGANPISLPGGAVGLLSEGRPNNGYVAFPDGDYQIEVYDPDANVVRELVTSGAVQPVPPPKAPVQARGPEAVTQEDLVALADELGHPVYWAGPRENTTYELTVNEAGAVYIRYLPPGVDVGEQRTALTVGTYPVEGAFALTEGQCRCGGHVDVPLPGPGIALHSEQTSNNVHVAYPDDGRADRGVLAGCRGAAAARLAGKDRPRRLEVELVEHAARTVAALPAAARGAVVRLRAAPRVGRRRPPARRSRRPVRLRRRRAGRAARGDDRRNRRARRSCGRRRCDCRLRRRAADGGRWARIAGLSDPRAGSFAVYAAPIVLSGSATFAGYIKLDDDSTLTALVDRAMEFGRNVSGLEPSTYQRTVDLLLDEGYPLASLLPMGLGDALLREDALWLYQPTMAFMAAMLALGLYALATKVVDTPWLRALAAFTGAQAALLYGYVLWGGIKEMGTAWALPVLAALVPSAIKAERLRELIPLAALSALLLGVLNAGALVWIAPALLVLPRDRSGVNGGYATRSSEPARSSASWLSSPCRRSSRRRRS